MGVKQMQRWEELVYAKNEGRQLGIEQGIEQGVLLQTYRMVERGRLTVQEALEDLQSSQGEAEFIEAMLAAGFKVPQTSPTPAGSK
jgi:hypothetical protein